jgi:hypothetical protein
LGQWVDACLQLLQAQVQIHYRYRPPAVRPEVGWKVQLGFLARLHFEIDLRSFDASCEVEGGGAWCMEVVPGRTGDDINDIKYRHPLYNNERAYHLLMKELRRAKLI